MVTMSITSICCTLIAGLLAGRTVWASDLPLGHKDFYPSPERPIGWRGDGNGAFPGATPVTHWREGEVANEEREYELWGDAGGNQRGTWSKKPVPVFKNRNAVNIVWKTEMPCFANSSPIVVGDRVFTTADPNTLLCVDIHTGKILWQDTLSPFELLDLPAEEIKVNQQLYEAAYAIKAVTAEKVGNYTRLPVRHMTPAYFQHYLEDLIEAGEAADKVIPLDKRANFAKVRKMIDEVVAELKRLIADPPKDDAAKQEVSKSLAKKISDISPSLCGVDKNPLIGWMAKEYGFIPLHHWEGWEGWTFGTPVSDGRHVFVNYGQHQVACYDLDGRRIWAVMVPDPRDAAGKYYFGGGYGKRSMDMRDGEHLCSPLLIGERLIVQRIGALVGLEKATGRKLWTAPVEKGDWSTSHKVMTLTGGRQVVACLTGQILDAVTAKELCALGMSNSGGMTMIARDDVVYMEPHGKPLTPFRLISEDKSVRAEKLWEGPKIEGHMSSILMDRFLFTKGMMVDIRDGRQIGGKQMPNIGARYDSPWISPIQAGRYTIHFLNSDRRQLRDFRRDDVLIRCAVFEVGQNGLLTVVAKDNWLGGENKPRMPMLEKYIPRCYARGIWSRETGTPDHFGYGSPFAQGNRILYRSCSHLYCIGDPKAPYNGLKVGGVR